MSSSDLDRNVIKLFSLVQMWDAKLKFLFIEERENRVVLFISRCQKPLLVKQYCDSKSNP